MNTNKESYTAADSFPLKVVMDTDLVSRIKSTQQITPIHAQFIPTNACNMHCSFCSCSEEDRSVEMPYNTFLGVANALKRCGTKAVTITGGGEPLMHPQIGQMINYFRRGGINVGLVTNGKILPHLATTEAYRAFENVTWCRISNGDERTFTPQYANGLELAVNKAPNVDWAFSHVVSKNPNYEEIARIITFANAHKFTHVRLVADLFEPGNVPLDTVKEYNTTHGVDDTNVIYQGRKNPERGSKNCYIGFLKPLIGADAKVYACCGVQYALPIPSKKLPQELSLGNALDMQEIMKNSSTPLDGSICSKCYYGSYNSLLTSLIRGVKHERFV